MENLDQKEYVETTIDVEKQPSLFWEIIKFAFLAIIIVLPIRMYIASPFIVNGSSMDPTFETGHYLIIDQISYRFEEPQRGEVIVFKYPKDPTKFFIKRLIGLPGETIKIEDGAVFIKNEKSEDYIKLEEQYLKYLKHDNLITTLKNNEYFVMGDNREASSDSRIWGPLNEEYLTGKVLIRLLPITKIDMYPGEVSY